MRRRCSLRPRGGNQGDVTSRYRTSLEPEEATKAVRKNLTDGGERTDDVDIGDLHHADGNDGRPVVGRKGRFDVVVGRRWRRRR